LALQRIRAVAGVSDLYAVESVLRGAGSGAKVSAGSVWIEEYFSRDGHGCRTHWAERDVARIFDGTGTNRHHAAADQPYRAVSVGNALVQPDERVRAERCHAGNPGDGNEPWYTCDGPWILFRHGTGVRGFQGIGEVSDHHGSAGGLHRAGHSVREHDSSADDHFDAAIGERGRDAGADAVWNRPQRDFDHRNHSADRNCEEERDHDD